MQSLALRVAEHGDRKDMFEKHLADASVHVARTFDEDIARTRALDHVADETRARRAVMTDTDDVERAHGSLLPGDPMPRLVVGLPVGALTAGRALLEVAPESLQVIVVA